MSSARNKRFTARQKVNYTFDAMMTRGPLILILWLSAFMLAMIIVFSSIVHYSHAAPGDEGLLKLIWISGLRTLDPGTIGGDDGGVLFLGTMLAATLFGILALSTLVGIITTGLNGKIESLRKGRSQVIESGHTVVLGWSEQIFTIISELSIANENQKDGCIAILADRDKVEMEDEVRARIPDTRGTRVVCRTGDPAEFSDLAIMSLETSKSIIILSPDIPDPDPEVVKILLALAHRDDDRDDLNLVTMVRDPRNVGAAQIAGGKQAEVILAGEIVAKMTAQTCLQSGLSLVYQELMDFDGDEIYFQHEPRLAGSTYREALFRYEASSVIGIYTEDGQLLIDPPADTVVGDYDRIIAISEDDDTVIPMSTAPPAPDESAIRDVDLPENGIHRLVMIGWNWRAPIIITEIDHYVQPGSEVKVVAGAGYFDPEAIPSGLKNLTVTWEVASTTDRQALERLDLPSYQHVIILSYSDHLEPQEADARTLITLLHCRDIADVDGAGYSLTSEMRDTRNRNLAEIAGADDYIVSDQVISLLLSQISENRQLAELFWGLFNADGSEIYLKPVERYVEPGREVDFFTVLESAARRGETAIGYRLLRDRASRDKFHGVVVNPAKGDRVVFEPGDLVVVLAED